MPSQSIEPAVRAAGAQLPIERREHRTLVTFHRQADSYAEAVMAEGLSQPLRLSASAVAEELQRAY
jgi:hypothetical protein